MQSAEILVFSILVVVFGVLALIIHIHNLWKQKDMEAIKNMLILLTIMLLIPWGVVSMKFSLAKDQKIKKTINDAVSEAKESGTAGWVNTSFGDVYIYETGELEKDELRDEEKEITYSFN